MIKGKFYTGLPSEMMARSRVVNRQNTNFFWPDETDMVSVTDKSKRTPAKVSPAPNVTNFNNDTSNSPDIKPKELFRKQLSSGIEFYDNVNAKTPESRRRRFKKIDNVNLNNNDGQYQPEGKKLETFSSKIEFYDFEHEKDVKTGQNGRNGRIGQPVKSMKKEIDINIDEMEQNKKDIYEMNNKRISFQAEEKTRGILKRSDGKSSTEKVVVKPLPKRVLLPKNMSKSVENISKMAETAVNDDLKMDKEPEKLSSIIREVKQLNLSQERKPSYDRYEKNETDNYYRRSAIDRYNDEPKWNNKDYSPRGEYRDEPDYHHYSERRYRNDGLKGPRYDDRYDDRQVRDREYNDYNRYDRRQPQPREIHKERSHHYDESPIRERNTGEFRNYERDYERRSPNQRKPFDSYYEKPPRSVRYDEEYSTTTSSSSSNRSPEHLPQHLRTNIVLGTNNVRLQTQRPLSVRDSAVTRVGVGLPDYE